MAPSEHVGIIAGVAKTTKQRVIIVPSLVLFFLAGCAAGTQNNVMNLPETGGLSTTVDVPDVVNMQFNNASGYIDYAVFAMSAADGVGDSCLPLAKVIYQKPSAGTSVEFDGETKVPFQLVCEGTKSLLAIEAAITEMGRPARERAEAERKDAEERAAAIAEEERVAAEAAALVAAKRAAEIDAQTLSQRNAIRSAEQYLDYSSFSRKGMIEQLVYEGYPKADAEYAVDFLEIDWYEQAILSAKAYLEYSAFSRAGLIEQLVYEGFSRDQAIHGVEGVGY